MPNGPCRIVLINAGRYDYAEVELAGSLQIVGPNNTGKTTLINALQFLYLDDRRHMEFGSYTPDQTREYYFPNQYTYVLFEVLGARGNCVIGWRGQNRVMGGEPERFYFEGIYERSDFIDEKNQVREPGAVNARLGPKQYTVLKSSQEHRELLLLATKGEAKGVGLVALRDNDRYSQFRITLKHLLTLSTISQDEMQDQLLMLADLPSSGHAFDVRELLGEDYDRILDRRHELSTFKRCLPILELLVTAHANREDVRSVMAYRWSDLRAKHQRFELQHKENLENLNKEAQAAKLERTKLLEKISEHQASKDELVLKKGSIEADLRRITIQAREFDGFLEDFFRSALDEAKNQIQTLQRRLEGVESETRSKAEQKVKQYGEQVAQAQRAIANFDSLLISFLRRHMPDDELSPLSRLFNFDLLEQPVSPEGVRLHRPDQLISRLQKLTKRIHESVYRDSEVELPLPQSPRNLTELESVEQARERLSDLQNALAKWKDTLVVVEERDSILAELQLKREIVQGKSDDQGNELVEGMETKLFRFKEFKKLNLEKPKLDSALKEVDKTIRAMADRIEELSARERKAGEMVSSLSQRILSAGNDYAAQIQRFNLCKPPSFVAEPSTHVTVSEDFSTAIDQYLTAQTRHTDLDEEIVKLLRSAEKELGTKYTGGDDNETVRLLREELDALPDKETVLHRDWGHKVTDLQATFAQTLKSLDDIKSAATRLNRELSRVHISNLASIHMEVIEQSDVVSPIRRLVSAEQPGLFENSADFEASISAFRKKFESDSLLRYRELFSLKFTVTGDDGKANHYYDFHQVESHGTTITIKVLFNLLVLRSLLREDSQRNLLCAIPFFLDEVHSLDSINRHAILETAKNLGFIALTAAPDSVSEVDALYFLQPQKGRITLRRRHSLRIRARKQSA